MQTEDTATVATRAQDRHKPFSGEFLPDSPAARTALAEAMATINAYETAERKTATERGGKRRRRSKPAQAKFEIATRALLCETAVATLTNDDQGFRCSRSKSFLEKEDRYRSPAINPLLPQALDVLADLGFIKQSLGRITDKGERRQTVVRPAAELVRLCESFDLTVEDFRKERPGDEIVLRGTRAEDDTTAPDLAYIDDGETRRMRAEVQAINAHLRQANITVLPIMGEDGLVDVDASKRKLRRIFTGGSFERGGRLYGGFWMMDLKAWMRTQCIRIDKHPVVELDFAQCSLRILYGLADAPAPTDADLYSIPGLQQVDRDDVKTLLSGLTFVSEDRVRELAPLARKLCPLIRAPIDGGMESMADASALRMVLDGLRQHHAPIAQFLPSEIGHQVQRIESDIMVRVLLTLNAGQITALPIHDSIVVRSDHEEAATSVMQQAFEFVTGVPGVVGVKHG